MAAAAALAITITAVRAEPSAVPSPPFDAVTVDGLLRSGIVASANSLTFDNNTPGGITPGPIPTGGLQLNASNSATDQVTVFVRPPTGSSFAAGTTYDTADSADSTHAQLTLSIAGSGCVQTGSMIVSDVSLDSDSNITSFAATYSALCDGASSPISGELRWQSATGYRAALTTPQALAFDGVDLGNTSAAKTVTVTSDGTDSLSLQAAVVSSVVNSQFVISNDGCAGKTLTYGQTCTVSVVGVPTVAGILQGTLAIPDNTAAGKRTVALDMVGIKGSAGTYSAIPPSRLLDTRNGTGAARAKVAAGGTVHFQVSGRGGVPASGASAVVLNVTETGNTAGGFVTVYPDTVTRPTVSNLNFSAGETRANSVTVQLGSNGKVAIYNGTAKPLDLIADVSGYFVANDSIASKGEFQPTLPQRILDSRTIPGGALPGGFFYSIPVDYGATADPHIRALAVNITSTASTASGFLIAWNGQLGQLPTTSVLNYAKGVTTPNFAVVPTSTCTDPSCAGLPMIGIDNESAGQTQLIVDIVGFFDDGGLGDGLRFHPMAPQRIVDSRSHLGISGPLGPAATAAITAPGTFTDDLTVALALNVTSVAPTASTFLTLWPAGITMPNVSTLNALPGRNVANAAITLVSGPSPNQFNVYNNAGTTGLLVDVAGTYEFYPFDDGVAPPTHRITPRLAHLPRLSGFQPAHAGQ